MSTAPPLTGGCCWWWGSDPLWGLSPAETKFSLSELPDKIRHEGDLFLKLWVFPGAQMSLWYETGVEHPCAFFLHPGTDVKEAQVICVSTGTKCINGEYMSDRGLALNDCHAEIVARRSLIRFLYSQLELFLRWWLLCAMSAAYTVHLQYTCKAYLESRNGFNNPAKSFVLAIIC